MKTVSFKYGFYICLTALLCFYAVEFDGGSFMHTSLSTIKNYQSVDLVVVDKNRKPYVAIRSYSSAKDQKYLLVDPHSLETSVMSASALKICHSSSTSASHNAVHTYFHDVLTKYTSLPAQNENYGLRSGSSKAEGIYLTIDMCPSTKPFEREFFQALIDKSKGQPVHVAISLTGKWALKHSADFAWLMKQNDEKKLAITWINHSYHHHYPVLASTKAGFVDEVLFTEKLLLERGQLPSILFRFPALISTKDEVLKLKKLNLIPVGSDAWLAKGQKAQRGSIVLVHGNGNEQVGITMATRLLMGEGGMKILPILDAVKEPNNQFLSSTAKGVICD